MTDDQIRTTLRAVKYCPTICELARQANVSTTELYRLIRGRPLSKAIQSRLEPVLSQLNTNTPYQNRRPTGS